MPSAEEAECARAQEYICSLLSCIKYSAYLDGARASGAGMGMSDSGANLRAAFNESFIRAFGQTGAFKLWDKTTDSVIFDLVEPQCVSSLTVIAAHSADLQRW